MAEPDPNSANQTEQLLADPEVRRMIAELKQQIIASLRKQAGGNEPQPGGPMVDDAVKWVEVLLTHPTVAFLSSVKVSPQGPDVRGGLLVNVGDEVDELKAALEKYGQVFLQGNAQSVEIAGDQYARIKPGPQAPVITWGIKGKYLIVGVGEVAVEAILKDARTPAPAWMTKLREQLPVDRVASVTHINLKAILEAASALPGATASSRRWLPPDWTTSFRYRR